MSVPWKALGARLRFANWSVMTWAVVTLMLVSTVVTVLVGIELYSVTGQAPQYNTH